MRAFYAPVGLTPYEISDIAEALAPLAGADGPDDAPEWKAAPPGLAPDLYLTHLRCVDLDDDGHDHGHDHGSFGDYPGYGAYSAN